MTESKFAFKSALTFLWLVVLIGLLCMLSKPVHAFESFEIDPEPVAYNPADNDWHFEYRDDDYYLYGGDYSFMGWDLSIPVPYYADRDHVSLFTSFSFQINNDYLYHDWCFYVAPADEYVLRNTLNGYGSVFLEGFTQQASSTVNSYRGTASFQWLPNNNCSMTYCMLKYDDGYYTTFKFFCVFDLELKYPQTEMRPFRLGVWDRSQNPSYTGVNWLLYLQNYRFCVLDTQVYSLLEQRLQLIIDQLGDLEVSVDLSSIETLISQSTWGILDLASIMSTLSDDLLEEPTPDAEITQAQQAYSELDEAVAHLSSLENDVLSGFESAVADFPTAPEMNYQMVGTYFLPFFNNPIIFALVLACLGMMVVFAII